MRWPRSRGRHRTTKTEPATYSWPLVETWESSRTAYAKPDSWLTRWLHHD